MSEFHHVASVAELPDPGKKLFDLDDRLLVLVRIGESFYCLDDVCTHDGGPLGEGRLDGFEIACPRHGARFDVRDGCAKSMPATEGTGAYQVKVEGGEVYVRLAPLDTSAPAQESVTAPSANGSNAASSTASSAPSPAATLPVAVETTAGCQHGDAAGSCAAAGVASLAPCSADAGPLSEDRVREELKRVIDPELFVNIVDLGLVYVVELLPVEAGQINVLIEMTMTSPMCPAGPQLIGQSKQFVGQLPTVANVEVKLVMDPPWSPDRMTDAARDQLGIF